MSKSQEHEIKTLQDILRAVKIENGENFLKDFSNFINLWMITRMKIELGNPESLEKTIESAQFVWKDDGKNNIKVTIEAVTE